MKRLSDLDTMMVTLDNERYPMHGGWLLVVDPSTASEPFTLARFSQHLRRLLPVMPPLRRRLVEVPFGLAAPVWVEDPSFDLQNHVNTLVVPAPGGDRELAAAANEIVNMPLDRRKPLWDVWFLDGLVDGKVGILFRLHHVMIDGMGGLEMLFQMFSTEPDRQAEALPLDTWQPESIPSPAEMLARALPTAATRPFRGGKALTAMGSVLARGWLKSAFSRESKPANRLGVKLFAGPRLPFNRVIDEMPHKCTAWANISMADVLAAKEMHGCTVNDVALALCTAALRKWLIDHDALPAGPITCGNPLNTRVADESGAFENRFAIFAINMPVDVKDPIERLKAINAATAAGKQSVRTSTTNVVEDLFAVLAPGVTELVINGLIAGLGSKAPAPFNTLVSNVRGPRETLYLCGAKLVRMHGIAMQCVGMSVIIAVFTYGDLMTITTVGHRQTTPDIWTLPDEMHEELRRLLKAEPTARG